MTKLDKISEGVGRLIYRMSRMDARQPRIPPLLRHTTQERNIPSIKKHGLKAAKDYIMEDMPAGVNFMANNAEDFFDFKEPHPIHVDPKNLDQKKLKHLGEGWWRYEGSVPPQHLKFKK